MKREKSVCVLPYHAHARHDALFGFATRVWSRALYSYSYSMQDMIKSATTGSTSELLRCREIAHRARPGPPEPPFKPRLEICTERLDPSPSRLRLAVVYAEQPPAASSTNAADA